MKHKIVTLTFLLYSLSGCYGSPDSFLVNFVGRDIDNYVDMTGNKAGTVGLLHDYKVVYLIETYDRYKELGDTGDKSFLVLFDTKTLNKEIILEGHLGYDIQYASILPDRKNIIFTFSDCRNDFDNTYLYIYNLDKKSIEFKYLIFNAKEYNKPNLLLGGSHFISDTFYNALTNLFYYKICYEVEPNRYMYNYFFIKLTDGPKKEIDEREYNRAKASLNPDLPVGYSFKLADKELKLFRVTPYHDYLPYNYKHKYNGIYINDGKSNFHISRIDGHRLWDTPPPIWIEGGEKVLYGSYLFDVTGRQNELKVVEGKLLSIIEE